MPYSIPTLARLQVRLSSFKSQHSIIFSPCTVLHVLVLYSFGFHDLQHDNIHIVTAVSDDIDEL